MFCDKCLLIILSTAGDVAFSDAYFPFRDLKRVLLCHSSICEILLKHYCTFCNHDNLRHSGLLELPAAGQPSTSCCLDILLANSANSGVIAQQNIFSNKMYCPGRPR